MSDPFGHLLASLKEGNVPSSKPGSKENSVTPGALTPQKKKLTPLHAESIVHGNGNVVSNTNIHDDLDDLFGSIPKKEDVAQDNHTSIDGLDLFQSSSDVVSKTEPDNQEINPFDNPFETEHKSESPTEEVIDEVRDMELAKLMSLGLNIDKASSYYERGITYEDVLRKRKQKASNGYQQRSNIDRKQGGGEIRNIFDTRGSGSESLFSGILNKGKELVNQLSTYTEEENERMNKFKGYEEYSRSETYLEKENSMNPGIFSRSSQEKIPQRAARPSHEKSNSSRSKINKRMTTEAPHKPFNDDDQSSLIESKDSSRESSMPGEGTLLDFDNDNHASSPVVNTSNQNTVSITQIPISHIEISGYNEFKARGTDYFKNGDYASAVEEYEKSLNTLPMKHPLRIIAYSNIIASRIKIGQHSQSVVDAQEAMKLLPEEKSLWTAAIQNSDPVRSYNDIWPKIILRQAESYEAIEKYKLALDAYQTLLEKNLFSEKVIAGKRRCQHALGLDSKPKSNPPSKSATPAPAPRRAPTVNRQTEVVNKKSVNAEKLKKENERLAKLEDQKVALYDKVEGIINSWKNGKQDDIRYLLSNLQAVITWTQWKPVQSSELVLPRKVKITYMKAVAKLHPDKLPSSLTLEQQMIAESVFSTLSDSWENFKKSNDIN